MSNGPATHPTPYPAINTLLHTLLSDAQTILGHHFVAMYLYGSLASGDFDPQRSDIDFVVVTDDVLPDELVSALEAMHTRLHTSGLPWATKLEGTYIPQHALPRYDPNAAPCPCLNEGRFYVARHESDWVIQRHLLREHGVVLAGPAPHTLIEPVQPRDLQQAVVGILREWWAPLLHNNPAWVRGSEYQAYAVLTMCRALYALQHGCIVSKPVAARWAQETLGERWAVLVAWALLWTHETTSDNLNETLGFIRYTLERGQRFELSMDKV